MGENPMITDPNLNHTEEAFKKLELLVVQDIFLTETAEMADVVLPASSFAEKDGTVVNSDRRVLRMRKAVELPGEAREDWRILAEVARRMHYSIGEYDNASQIWDEISRAAPIFGGISYERIEEHGIQWPCPTPDHPGTATLFLDRFNTPSGKAKLHPVEHVAQRERASKEYPFILNSGRILYQYHSSTMSRRCPPLRAFADSSYVLMHPDDASALKLRDAQRVRISSRRGDIDTTLRISGEVAPGELFMPWHYSESQVNRLTRDELDPLSKIAPFKYSAVKVRASAD
jgi:predicted molibdopterin-dependent oxidoreductase YjgC